jgi:hypothetical protein
MRIGERIGWPRRSARDECLNANYFLSLDAARRKIEAWRVEYNAARPHSSLGDRSPAEFITRGEARWDSVMLSGLALAEEELEASARRYGARGS